MSTIKKKLNLIENELKEIDKEAIKIVGVTKGRTSSEINAFIAAGGKIIAENKVKEASIKFLQINSNIKKHFIGHLQTNKVKDALLLFDLIQSVDSLKLLEKIQNESQKKSLKMPIFLQINISSDPDKYGFSFEEAIGIAQMIKNKKNLSLQGLMTILKFGLNNEEIFTYYTNMKNLFEKIKELNLFDTSFPELSMGMSDDYLIAARCGATMIRLGRKIFS